ncbi:MAG: pilus assembly protein PilM [Candidatus Jorgensenbacteria bacterium]|nr:pilus assembly protein PilM [Candidatus Jorgensenbacteria bacterium]
MSVFSDFINDIKNAFSSNRVLGIDIGTVSVKLIEVSRTRGALAVSSYGILETKDYLRRANAALQTGSLKISERDIVPLLKTIVRESGVKTNRVVASLPSFGAFFAPIDMPIMSSEDTAKAVSFQARQYIPLEPGNVTVDWVKIGEFENDQHEPVQRILITGIPNNLIARYRSIFHAAGLKLVALEIETSSLARAFERDIATPKLIIDIGGESSAATVVHKGIPHELGQTDHGGLTLTQAISRSLGISTVRAEDLKCRRGLSKSGNEYELSTSLYPFLDVIIQEAQHVRDTYEKKSGMKIQSLSIVGGGANLVGIEEYIKNQLNLTTIVPAILNRFAYSPELEPVLQYLNRELAVAAGLALRFFAQ